MAGDVAIRRLASGDAIIAATFAVIDWHKPEAQYVRYLEERGGNARLAEVGIGVGLHRPGS